MMESTFRRCRGDGGFVGGAEGILFGIAVVVVGALLVYNAWAVVDAKMAASSAAREAVRFYVESDGDQSAAPGDGEGRSDSEIAWEWVGGKGATS